MKSQTEIRKNVTDQIIETLKKGGLPPWRKLWCDDPNAPGMHTSLSTSNAYRGINQLILQTSAVRQGFKSRWWGTFNQIRQNNSVVRKGQKATKVLLWKPICRKRVNENGKEIDENFLIMREFAVFNAEQTTDLKQFQVDFSMPQESRIERYENADHVTEATGTRIEYGGNQPCYRPHADLIELPFRHQFTSSEAFYETALHERVHWAEHKDRVGRSKDHKYAFAELVAEIGACFLMDELGLPTERTLANSTSYLKGWLKAMADDPKFIFTASAQASRCVDHILSTICGPTITMLLTAITAVRTSTKTALVGLNPAPGPVGVSGVPMPCCGWQP